MLTKITKTQKFEFSCWVLKFIRKENVGDFEGSLSMEGRGAANSIIGVHRHDLESLGASLRNNMNQTENILFLLFPRPVPFNSSKRIEDIFFARQFFW